jgi:hypothetical protein
LCRYRSEDLYNGDAGRQHHHATEAKARYLALRQAEPAVAIDPATVRPTAAAVPIAGMAVNIVVT